MATGDRAAAEDAVQEALARAWARSERGEEIRSIEAWVAVVALNLARSGVRRLAAERRARARLIARSSFEVGTEDRVEIRGELTDLRTAISTLPRRQREMVVLRYYLDLDVAEAARALGITQGTAKKALHRARSALQAKLEVETHAKGGRADAPSR